jgi:hypothetical protein
MRTTAVGAGLLLAFVLVAAAAVGGVAAGTTQADNETQTNASFGADVSSFMQASSAETQGGVDDGMFDAALNRTDDPEERRALIENRTERLQERHDRIAERRQAVNASGEPGVREYAVAAHVTVGASSLERSLNETERAAEAAGLDTQRLETLRTNARNLTGPEVAELARGLASPPSAAQRGPLGNVTDGETPGMPDVPGADGNETARNWSAGNGDRAEATDRQNRTNGGGDDSGADSPSDNGAGNSGSDSTADGSAGDAGTETSG